ncbi:ankyrin repeat protein [Zalerion maritima]|uniref:Ankyrin repeat protein n=1 Tax=Zalerion maritima TaxID=339359 RepID=A0AAD5WNP2_9PEZI|nr:ankyrin repeat protein [Zalerion maritima]
MADLLSLASVVGFGLDWRDAPKESKKFFEELQTLQLALPGIVARLILEFDGAFDDGSSLLLAELGPNAPPDSNTRLMLNVCEKELSGLLEKLNAASKGGRLGWKRFRSAFIADRTREAVGAPYRQCSALNGIIIFDTAALCAATNKGLKELRKEQQGWTIPSVDGRKGQVNGFSTLKSSELRHAFDIKEGSSSLSEKYIPLLEDLVSICAGLTTVDQSRNVIRLVHYTTQGFFDRNPGVWFEDAQNGIAVACITYMSLAVFDQADFCLTDNQLETRPEVNPFYLYACRNWGHHVRSLTPSF